MSRNFRGILYRKQLRPRAAGNCSTDYERELNGSRSLPLGSNVEQQHSAGVALAAEIRTTTTNAVGTNGSIVDFPNNPLIAETHNGNHS